MGVGGIGFDLKSREEKRRETWTQLGERQRVAIDAAQLFDVQLLCNKSIKLKLTDAIGRGFVAGGGLYLIVKR